MKLKIHRGTGQIGGVIIEVATNKTRIILDCGQNLPPLDDPNAPDNIDIPGLTSGAKKYDAVFISHHHGDHCGLIGRVHDDTRIYMSEITRNVLEITADFINKTPPRVDTVLTSHKPEDVGDIIVTPLPVMHSAWGAMMFLVEADGQKLLYTGDFNDIHEDDYSLLKNVDVLLCEGTNAKVQSDKTENTVRDEAIKIMNHTEGEIFVLCSTTNIERIKAIEAACKECKGSRSMTIDPFMKSILDSLGYTLKPAPTQFLMRGVTKGENPRIDKYITWIDDKPSRKVYTSSLKIAKGQTA